jgi:hypothetical protein
VREISSQVLIPSRVDQQSETRRARFTIVV